MQTFAYPARLVPEKKGGYTVRFDDLPEAITCGDNRADALAQAADCLDEAIAARMDDGREIPTPSEQRRGRVLVPLPAARASKAALYLAMRELGVSNLELARRLKVQEREVRRMLDPRHPTKLTRIQQVLDSLGKRLVISIDNAA